MNWQRARELGYSFAYVKATDGVTLQIKSAAEHVSRARAAGFDIGLYHFHIPWHGAGAQFAAIVEAHKALGVGAGDLVPVVDVESWGNAQPPRRAEPSWAAGVVDLLWLIRNRFGDACRYHNVADWVAMGNPEGLRTFPLWLADYTGPANLPEYELWQHAPRLIDGVYPAPIDWSEARGLVRIEDGPSLPGPAPVVPMTPENIAALAADAAREGIR